MNILKKIKNALFGSYGEWFLNQISNQGLGFAFVDRQLVQDHEAREARLTLTLLDAAYRCGIEVNIKKTLVEQLGIGMPAGFQQQDLYPLERDKDDPAEIRFCRNFNKTRVRWVADEPLIPGQPRTIIFPVENLEKGYGQVTIGLPFKLGLGGGNLNANTLIGLGSPGEIEVQTRRWKDLKLHWQQRHDEFVDQDSSQPPKEAT